MQDCSIVMISHKQVDCGFNKALSRYGRSRSDIYDMKQNKRIRRK